MSGSGEGKYPTGKWNEGHCEHKKVQEDKEIGDKGETERAGVVFCFSSPPFDPRSPSVLPHREPLSHLTEEVKDDPNTCLI